MLVDEIGIQQIMKTGFQKLNEFTINFINIQNIQSARVLFQICDVNTYNKSGRIKYTSFLMVMGGANSSKIYQT